MILQRRKMALLWRDLPKLLITQCGLTATQAKNVAEKAEFGVIEVADSDTVEIAVYCTLSSNTDSSIPACSRHCRLIFHANSFNPLYMFNHIEWRQEVIEKRFEWVL